MSSLNAMLGTRPSGEACTSYVMRLENGMTSFLNAIIMCKRPEIPTNGNIKELQNSNAQLFPFAFELTYICSPGFRLLGPKSRLCDAQGWTGQVPVCDVIRCEGTPMLENGRAISGRSKMLYYPGEELQIHCDIGYTRATSNHYILCDDNGKWNVFASCTQILCNFPEVPLHAVLEASKGKESQYRFGDIVNYSCEDGYFLQGKKLRTCEQDGWSGRPPICREVTCSLPELPRNGMITEYKEIYKYRETVEYSCQPRYVLYGGARTRTCTETGWTGAVPSCYVAGCEHLTIPNGRLILRANQYGYQSLGNFAVVACNHKYRLHDQAFFYCTWTGNWQGKLPSCVDITCPAVDRKMMSTAVDQKLYYPGENITIKCPHNFEPVDGNHMIMCLDNGKWSGVLATCAAVSCPEPPLIENADVIPLFEAKNNDRSYSPRQQVLVSCFPGYTTLGKEEKNKCLENGKWQNPFPTCTVISCEKPAVPINGRLKPNQSTFIFNDLAEYECNVGYQLVGERQVRCGYHGWFEQAPHCKVIQCPTTFRDSAGNIETKSENTKYGDVAQVMCYRQYRLNGDENVRCMGDGTWSKRPQQLCEAITCDPPELPAFGFLNIKMPKYRLYQGVTYHCPQGFLLRGKEQLTCLENGWSDKPPKCEAIEVTRCPEPPVIPHGKIMTAEIKEYKTGDRLNFTCDPGYIASLEKAYALCGVNGSWNLSAAYCQEDLLIPCQELPVIIHGQLQDVRNKTYFPGDTITVVCDPGYYSPLLENTYVVCSNHGLWDYTAVQSCEAIFCEVPQLNSNLSIVERGVAENVSFGFEINFRCSSGYYLVGQRWSTCGENGWSAVTPLCKKVKCNDPGYPEGGQRLGTSFNVGDKVVFSCFSGFTLIGDRERICLSSGQWSGRLTRCNAAKNYCVNPGIPVNGVKSGSRYMLGEIVDFRCKPGFTLVGPRRRICLHTKQWNGKETKCLGQHEFDSYDRISDGVKTLIETIKKRQAAELEKYHQRLAQEGPEPKPFRIIVYFIVDTSTSIGRRNFQITIQFMKAIVKYLEVTEDGIRVGLITFSKNAKVEFLPEKYNNTVSVLKALDELNYTEGGTKLEAALKLLHDKVIPSTRKRFNIPFGNPGRIRRDPRLKSVAFVLTDGKFSMSDNPEAVARKLRAAVRFFCFGLTGHPRKDVLYSVVTSRADQIALMDSYDRLKQLTEELLLKKNDYRCGVTSEESDSLFWSWIAYVGHVGTDKIICRGSLVSNTWVLTSASCLEAQSSIFNFESLFLNVYFDGSEEVHKVLLVVVHPGFQPNTSDFDMALLKLTVPVEYSTKLRPICLPPADFGETDLYQENAKTYMTVGKMEDNESYYIEQNLALPIQSNDTCGANLHSERMFCAGDGTVHSELCIPSQRGSPVLQHQRDEENRLYWTQVGIHISNSQCTTGSYYIHFTHVAKLRNWLDEVIQKM